MPILFLEVVVVWVVLEVELADLELISVSLQEDGCQSLSFGLVKTSVHLVLVQVLLV
jgi:hypothetical protein